MKGSIPFRGTMSKQMDEMLKLAKDDKNAARLMAVFYAMDEELEPEIRTLFLRSAIGISEPELERCLGVLQAAGLGRLQYWS